jgi:hypothetical protein
MLVFRQLFTFLKHAVPFPQLNILHYKSIDIWQTKTLKMPKILSKNIFLTEQHIN